MALNVDFILLGGGKLGKNRQEENKCLMAGFMAWFIDFLIE
jgi:hypothetical protein